MPLPGQGIGEESPLTGHNNEKDVHRMATEQKNAVTEPTLANLQAREKELQAKRRVCPDEEVIAVVNELRRVQSAVATKQDEGEKGARDAFAAQVEALGAVKVPAASTVAYQVRRGDDGKLYVESAIVRAPVGLVDDIYAHLKAVIGAGEKIASLRLFTVDGASVKMGGIPKEKTATGNGGNGAGRGAELTVDGKAYPSAMGAYKAVLGEPKAPMNRKSIIGALTSKGHQVS